MQTGWYESIFHGKILNILNPETGPDDALPEQGPEAIVYLQFRDALLKHGEVKHSLATGMDIAFYNMAINKPSGEPGTVALTISTDYFPCGHPDSEQPTELPKGIPLKVNFGGVRFPTINPLSDLEAPTLKKLEAIAGLAAKPVGETRLRLEQDPRSPIG